MRLFPSLVLTMVTWNLLSGLVQALPATWRPVRGGILFGISGIALVDREGDQCNFLIAHDNKGGPDQSRLAWITTKANDTPTYRALGWPSGGDLPLDLEALTAVPGRPFEFVTMTSTGEAYHVSLNAEKQVTVLRRFGIPLGKREADRQLNFESFGLQSLDGQLVAVWAHRGKAAEPGILYWGTMDLDTYRITQKGGH